MNWGWSQWAQRGRTSAPERVVENRPRRWGGRGHRCRIEGQVGLGGQEVVVVGEGKGRMMRGKGKVKRMQRRAQGVGQGPRLQCPRLGGGGHRGVEKSETGEKPFCRSSRP